MPSRKPERTYGRNFRPANFSSSQFRTKKVVDISDVRANEKTSQDEKIQATQLAHSIDESMGFPRYDSGKKKTGWLCNMHSTSIEDEKNPNGRAGVDYYFLEDDGSTFKATLEYDPYFLIAVRKGYEVEVEEWCCKYFEGLLKGVKRVEKEDLQMPNHLLGYRRTLLQLIFANVGDLLGVRKVVMPIAEKNRKSMNAMDTYAEVARWVRYLAGRILALTDFRSINVSSGFYGDDDYYRKQINEVTDASDHIVDIREYDVPYHVRVAIDKGRLNSRFFECARE